MPDAFFQKKRKRTNTSAPSSRAGPSRTKPKPASSSRKDAESSDDDLPGGGIDDLDLTHTYTNAPNSDDEAEAAETPAEARVRLAKMYLEGLSSSAPSGGGDDFFEADGPQFGLADAAQADKDNIAARLQKDVAEQSGKVHLFLADRIAAPRQGDLHHSTLAVRGHRLSVTSAVASSDAKWLFTASKDGSIIRWRLKDGKMMRIIPKRSTRLDENGFALPPTSAGKSKTSGAARRRARMTSDKGKSKDETYLAVNDHQGHTDEVWTLSLSSDGQYLASAGKDRQICIWSAAPSAETFVKSLSGHKDAVTAVSFRSGSNELYSASLDRTLKLYDVAQLSYIETLFGHQESVLSLSCLSAETAVSAGGRDRTCRFWKIRDESQLVFRAGIRSRLREVLEGGDLAGSEPKEAVEGSVEVVAMVDNHHFVSGGDSGSIALWNLGKKKPIFSVPVAHGWDVVESESEGRIRKERWITSLACLAYGDVFVSGSWDGSVRVWGLTVAGGMVKGFKPLFEVPVQGVVNSLQIVQPPLNSVVVEAGQASTTAVQPSQWKRRQGLASLSTTAHQDDSQTGTKLSRLERSSSNAPPIIIAAIGQEHKFGRWIKVKAAKNGTLVIPLTLQSTEMAASRRKENERPNGDFRLM